MDNNVQRQIDSLAADLKTAGMGLNDPVSKLMVATLLHQAQKIKDEIAALPDRIVERLCSAFVPKDRTGALPALAFLQPALKAKREMAPHRLAPGSLFTFKTDAKQSLSYCPLYSTLLLPVGHRYLMTPTAFRDGASYTPIQFGKAGQVWLGMELDSEVESLDNMSFLIKGTQGVVPARIQVGASLTKLDFAGAERMDLIPMLEPFDSQQMDPKNLAAAAHWQSLLAQPGEGRLIYITDRVRDRDLFKHRPFPKIFQQSLESAQLDKFSGNILWILFDFGSDYEVPEDIEILPNVVPAVNVSINSATLTSSTPIAKLTKNDGSFFFTVVETPLSMQKQGFGINEEDFVVRDFDSRGYNPDNLVKDVRNLYNHFIDDYYAFVEYHGLKDGELIRSLRETVNKIGKSVTGNPEGQNRFDEGVYAMRNINSIGQPAPIKVSYLTTMGRKGNQPTAGTMMENKKDAALEKEVPVVMDARGGEDRATADQMYELLRYYTMTADRLYTKMDVDAFLRLRLAQEFGPEEAKRISFKIRVQGAEGSLKLKRGLYVDIQFRDKKNYQKASATALDRKLHQEIADKSCISMPVIITLLPAEE